MKFNTEKNSIKGTNSQEKEIYTPKEGDHPIGAYVLLFINYVEGKQERTIEG